METPTQHKKKLKKTPKKSRNQVELRFNLTSGTIKLKIKACS